MGTIVGTIPNITSQGHLQLVVHCGLKTQTYNLTILKIPRHYLLGYIYK